MDALMSKQQDFSKPEPQASPGEPAYAIFVRSFRPDYNAWITVDMPGSFDDPAEAKRAAREGNIKMARAVLDDDDERRDRLEEMSSSQVVDILYASGDEQVCILIPQENRKNGFLPGFLDRFDEACEAVKNEKHARANSL